jgi:hypothetical protein
MAEHVCLDASDVPPDGNGSVSKACDRRSEQYIARYLWCMFVVDIVFRPDLVQGCSDKERRSSLVLWDVVLVRG